MNYVKTIGKERIFEAKVREAEDLLAHLVALAFAADYPDLFRPVQNAGQYAASTPVQSVAAIIALQPNGSRVK